MEAKDQLKYMNKHYGFNLPYKAKYKRFTNRIYFVSDFKDGEEITFVCMCEKPSACAIGNVWYKGIHGSSRLVNVKELEE